MHLYHQLEEFKDQKTPVVLTIGNFDGVHLGHLAVLQRSQAVAKRVEAHTVVITFSNHPSEVLRPEDPTLLLCTLPHKIALLEANQVDHLMLLPFTRYLALHSAASFVERVRQFIPFSHLILGHDATLGRDRQGNRDVMQSLAEAWGFEVYYLEEYRYEGLPVSSTRIRQLVQKGEFDQAEVLLGRPYSIYSGISTGLGKGRQIGYPTANIPVKGLCLPPQGVYVVEVNKDGKIYQGIANLGVAPTVRQDGVPLLEVHILAENVELSEHPIEVIFLKFIRPERKFDGLEALREQIKQDVDFAKNYQKQRDPLNF
ncbi:putative riboflavin kinase/FMN adenylyltransferase [Candidatus Protochlamydia naegleriophila]|uniref:Riboflavin biosynthesis protein n=1 Tax=Candidatus Protochlamydia naegleriophila TaxID=389348 RepID=A0A0U5ES20_9BACT|nr:bifunctional riboflavin kinase/FAD synthetase [Candidatus Protochlamydia naegleriophila]CUI16979.1 putative riboflavin kinase/FMN adenylyltransferase [Candidatus Protochlamydia naegleriophila]